VNLRAKPTTKNSDVLKVLYPNQKVRLVERKKKWIGVEYYNHILDIHENGWCFKKYLKKCSKAPIIQFTRRLGRAVGENTANMHLLLCLLLWFLSAAW